MQWRSVQDTKCNPIEWAGGVKTDGQSSGSGGVGGSNKCPAVCRKTNSAMCSAQQYFGRQAVHFGRATENAALGAGVALSCLSGGT